MIVLSIKVHEFLEVDYQDTEPLRELKENYYLCKGQKESQSGNHIAGLMCSILSQIY